MNREEIEKIERMIKMGAELIETTKEQNKLLDGGLREIEYWKGRCDQLEKRVEDAKDLARLSSEWIRWTVQATCVIIIGLLIKIAFF